MRFILTILAVSFFAFGAANAASFDSWKNDFMRRAGQTGVSASLLHHALDDVQLNQRVIELDQKQPEGQMTLEQYVQRTVTPDRISRGKAKLQANRNLLESAERHYGVPKEIIVALWGKESEYGGYTGNFSTIDALATLAYEGRRRAFFEQELLNAIQLLNYLGWPKERLTGSWAGAVGHCQFMPSNYLKYAVDGNGDGKADLWNSPADVFASMAYFLKELGWQSGIPWGQRVTLPAQFDNSIIGRDKEARDLSFWEQRGVRLTQPLPPQAKGALRLYQPDGPNGPAYLLTPNFDILMRWNRSGYFATAVGRLSDRFANAE